MTESQAPSPGRPVSAPDGRPSRSGSPHRMGGSPEGQAATPGREHNQSRAPSRALPVREPGSNWPAAREEAGTAVGPFAIVVLNADSTLAEVLTGAWRTARDADVVARALPRHDGYLVVRHRPVASGAGPFVIVVRNGSGTPIEVLTGAWPTARIADIYARTLPRTAGYLVAPCRAAPPPGT